MRRQLQTARFVLQLAERRHYMAVQSYLRRNAEFFRPWSPSYPAEYFDAEYIYHQLDAHYQGAKRGLLFHWLIFHPEDKGQNYILGDFSYSHIQRGSIQQCQLGYKLDQRVQRQGIMQEALICGNGFVFEELGLHRVEASIMPENKPSLRLIERLGFAYEGLARASIQVAGQWRDHRRYALLNPRDNAL